MTHGNGALLIVAGAGTGKTRTLAYRVSYLLEQGIQPERILLLTFTRRAAEQMLKRAASVAPSGVQAHRVWGGTFHAVANRLLRVHARPAGLSPDFTILDRSDAEDLLDLVRNDMGLARTDYRFPRKSTCMDIYSRRVNGHVDLETVLAKHFPWCAEWYDELKALFREYAERKEKGHLLDYDDLLLYWYFLLDDDGMADALGGAFEHILVDEYQDTNRIQAGILVGMRRGNPNITAVGDDAQSIYSFRSATVENMLDFPHHFPGARVITLEQNYRSVEPILKTANCTIAQERRRYSKDLWSARKGGQRPQLVTCVDDTQQDEWVIGQVLEHREQGIPLHKQAVLFRATSHSASLELALARKNIPFRKYGGLRFLEAAHIKDVLCLLRIVENPRDEVAWFRVLQLLPGIGPATAGAAFQHVASAEFDLTSLATFGTPEAAREDMARLGALLSDLVSLREAGPAQQLERVVPFYLPLLERRYERIESRVADIRHLAQLARGCASVREFVSDLVLDPPVSTGDMAGPPVVDEDWLVLSTIHSAKGLEWDAVYLIHAADGCLPSDMATGDPEDIEEELRLMYVALTRARDYLYVLWPLRYYHSPPGVSDNHSYAQRSRFLTDAVVETMEVAEAAPQSLPDPEAPTPGRVNVASRIRRMWQ